MSNSNLPISKTFSASSVNAPSFTPSGPATSNEGQKRVGSFGAAVNTRSSGQSPRNKQASKQQNKQTRRYNREEDEELDVRSMGSRKAKTNITHLMNFSLPPRQSFQQQHDNYHGRQHRKKTWGLGSGYHAVDKAR